MRKGYIYALYHKGNPFYIGQTINSLKDRLSGHRSKSFLKPDKLVNKYIRMVTTKCHFYDDISIRLLCECDYYDLNIMEMKYIKYCIDNNHIIYNSCVKTLMYKVNKSLKYNKNKITNLG